MDRAFCNVLGGDQFPNSHLRYLPRTTSDHAPMHVTLERKASPYGYPSFKFQQMWVSHDLFLECVSQSWKEEVRGSALFRLAAKLKRLKSALRTWNKEVFGRMEGHIACLEARIDQVERSLQDNFSPEDELKLITSQLELKVWMDREEQRLSQQAKQSWLGHGEASTGFFHSISRRNHT